MKLSKTDSFVISTIIEDFIKKTDTKTKTTLTKEGLKRLAKIHSRLAEELLPVNRKDVFPLLLEKIQNSIIPSE